MTELGDLREGLRPDELLAVSDNTMELPGVRLVGIGGNLLCASGVLPSVENMQQLANLAEEVEQRQGVALTYVSGGNSSCLPLLAEGLLPPKVNSLRTGYSLLLGRNAITGDPWEGAYQDAFVLEGELIEKKIKPSLPTGQTGVDAFGKVPTLADKGDRVRGIVSLGRLDLDPSSLFPRDPAIETITASSDHLIVDLTDAQALRSVAASSSSSNMPRWSRASFRPMSISALSAGRSHSRTPRRCTCSVGTSS